MRIYCGTYAKYNGGSIAGEWIDLEDFQDKDGFLEACAELHADESDPEFMFQDFEGFPSAFYGESCLDERLFDWIALDDDERQIVWAFLEDFPGASIEDAISAFAGCAASKREFAEEYADSTGMLDEVPDSLKAYFDFDSFARDLFFDFNFVMLDGKGFVFHNN